MNEEPLRVIPPEWRAQGASSSWRCRTRSSRCGVEGDLDPASRFIFKALMPKYEGDWAKMVSKHVRVRRLVLSEKDRVGVGTFQPKDEKNQDSTELTGDINYRKIAEYGSDSDPRAFNFDGEFNIANRGIIEFIEILKLDVAFLYDLLGATQEHKIKPKKFAQTDIDEVIIGHTNEAEYKKLLNNEFMEALRDRTIKIDIPYITQADRGDPDLREGLQRPEDQGQAHRPAHAGGGGDVGGADAPGGSQEAQPVALAEAEALRRQGAAGVHAGHVKELRKEAKREGMEGISPALRAGQDLQRAGQRPGRGDASTRSWC